MTAKLPLILLLTLSGLLFRTSSFAQEVPDLQRGKTVFQKCVSCHDATHPRNKMGPHLNGLVGRKAGSIEGYKYSQAMHDAGDMGLIWDEAKLKEFIASPKAAVPGTSMRFFGLWSESDVDDVIAYIKSLPIEDKAH